MAGRRPSIEKPQQRGRIEVVGDEVPQYVEPGLPDVAEPHAARRHEGASGLGGDDAEERPPEPVVLEYPVPRRPPHHSGGAAVEERRAAGDLDEPVVDLVTLDRLPQRSPPRPPERLLRREPRPGRQQPEPGDHARPALDGVHDLGGEHLVPAADPEHGPPGGAAGPPRRPPPPPPLWAAPPTGEATIGSPPQIPSTGRPAAARRCNATSRPRARSHARSATVDRVPGRTARSAASSSPGRVTSRTSTPGSTASASRSVTFDSRGRATTATLSGSRIASQ